MTPVRRRPPRARGPDSAPQRQARYWDARYRSDPALFGTTSSPFLRWVLAALRTRPVGSVWVELGSGYGRDLGPLRALGFSVRGVDISHVGTTLARRTRLDAVRAPALRFLSRVSPDSVNVVFSNLFLNMEFSEEEHDRLFGEIYRVLSPGGYHAYSVRSVADRWYGRGERKGPDTFDLSPDGPVLHFFSREYARRLRRGRLRVLRTWEGIEGEGEFPISVLYILEQKRTGRRPDLTP
jgi:SAM-dependent methyltransferase